MLSWLKKNLNKMTVFIKSTIHNGPYNNVAVNTTSTGSFTRPMPSTIYTGTGNPFSIATTPPIVSTQQVAAIQISNPVTANPVIIIHQDGSVEYFGKPSEAADTFFKALGHLIDLKAAGTLALEKTYRRAIERCLNQSKSMSHEDFVAMLENELEVRNSKAVLMRLSEDDSNAE